MSLLDGELRLTETMVESVRLRRLRWRLRGAWAWPTFLALTIADAVVLARLPFQGDGIDLFGALIAAGFFNVLTLALLAPLGGFLLRRRRRDLPFLIARDYAGTACLVVVFCGLLAAGLVHRGELEAERADRIAVSVAVHDYVVRSEPGYRDGLPMLDTIRTEDARYRACVPGGEELPLCFYVNTDQSPPGIVRDTERYSNAQLQR
jgi:hypothetical protein